MQDIFDKFQITELINSYTIHLDIERIDVCRDLFIEDGKLELRIGKAKGKEEIEALLSKIVEFTRGPWSICTKVELMHKVICWLLMQLSLRRQS